MIRKEFYFLQIFMANTHKLKGHLGWFLEWVEFPEHPLC